MTASAGSSSATVTLRRTGDTTGAIGLSLRAESPRRGNQSFAVTFAAGSEQVTVSVPTVDDAIIGADTVALSLEDLPANVVTGPGATLVIGDNDQPGTIRFASATATVNEGSSVTLQVMRTGTRLGGNVGVTWDVVGGTGAYVGATGSGTGTVRPDEEEVFVHMLGTVDVPGVEFDTAPPVLSGIPRAMRVRGAGRTTVRFAKPVARDAVDGDVAVTCTPASGSRFARGPTTVECSAADSSGNVAEARFRVLVRKP